MNDQHLDFIPNHYIVKDEYAGFAEQMPEVDMKELQKQETLPTASTHRGETEITPPERTSLEKLKAARREPNTFDEITRREICMEYGYDMDEDEASTLWEMEKDWDDYYIAQAEDEAERRAASDNCCDNGFIEVKDSDLPF